MRRIAIALTVLTILAGLTPIGAPSAGAQTVANPDLVPSCGVSITLVIDRSNSIDTTEANDIRDASRALIRGLVGTGAKVQVIAFGTRAVSVVRSATGIYSYGDLADLRYYDASELVDLPAFYAPGDAEGGTNWDDALELTRQASGISALTVFLTDGNPTYRLSSTPDGHGGAISGTGSSTSSADLSQAVQEADFLKSGAHPAGARPASHLFGIGVGLTDATSESRLASVTGPDELTLSDGEVLVNGAPGEFATADYTIVPNFADLEFAFIRFVWALCSQDFTMTTQLQRTDGTTLPATGLAPLTVNLVAGPPTPQAWELPPLGATSTAQLTTGADGQAQFRWRPTSPSPVTNLAITVSGLPSGFTFNGVRCTTDDPASTTDPPVVILDTVGPNQGGSTQGAAAWSIPGGINIHLDGTCQIFFRELRAAAPTTEQIVITATALAPDGTSSVRAVAVIELDDPAATDARIMSWRTG